MSVQLEAFTPNTYRHSYFVLNLYTLTSGVTSRMENPVPPVVRIRSSFRLSLQMHSLSWIDKHHHFMMVNVSPLCVCVCLCVHVCVCIPTMCVCMRVHYICAHAQMHACMCVCVCVCLCMHMCMTKFTKLHCLHTSCGTDTQNVYYSLKPEKWTLWQQPPLPESLPWWPPAHLAQCPLPPPVPQTCHGEKENNAQSCKAPSH